MGRGRRSCDGYELVKSGKEFFLGRFTLCNMGGGFYEQTAVECGHERDVPCGEGRIRVSYWASCSSKRVNASTNRWTALEGSFG